MCIDQLTSKEKFLAITCDNASANNSMVDELFVTVDGFAGEAARVRCFLHIISIVAKTLLKQFDVPPKKKGDKTQDVLDQELYTLAAGIEEEELQTQAELEDDEPDDNVNDIVHQWELNMDDDEQDSLHADLRPIRLLLLKLRKLAFKIIHSTTIILPVWCQILKQLNLDNRIMPRDVTTRWNSTFDMLNFALKYRAAIDKLTGDRTMELRTFELHDSDWEIATQLRDTLLIFKDATLFFSRGTPNLATVIPAMDLIDKRLATDSLKRSLRRPIVAAVKIAKAAMNRYYTKTDHSETYRIAMGELCAAILRFYVHMPSCPLFPVFQSSTLAINSPTSKNLAGNLSGSRMRKLLYVKCSRHTRSVHPPPTKILLTMILHRLQ
jgi:hypothetical protein